MNADNSHTWQEEEWRIDYVVANSIAKRKIKKLKVQERIESDHLALEMELEGTIGMKEQTEDYTMRKSVRWDLESVNKYRKVLEGGIV